MAYGEKYNLTFSDNEGVQWSLHIFEKDYAGATSSIKASGNPVIISWKGENLFDSIHPSECILNLIAETNFQFSEFFDAGELDYLVQIKKSGSLWWEGINIVENYSEPYVDIPYNIKLRFSDGLGSLKYIKYEDGGLITGIDKIIDIIVFCLNKLPYQKEVVEMVNILEENIPDIATNGFLNTTYLSNQVFIKFDSKQQIFEGWDCLGVLKRIMESIGATIFQSNNQWHIYRIEELEKNSIGFIEYNAGFSTIKSTGNKNIQKTITNQIGGIRHRQTPELAFTDVFNEIEYLYAFVHPYHDSEQLITDYNCHINMTASTLAERVEYWIPDIFVAASQPGAFDKSVELIPREGGVGYTGLDETGWTTGFFWEGAIVLNKSQLNFGVHKPYTRFIAISEYIDDGTPVADVITFRDLFVGTSDNLELEIDVQIFFKDPNPTTTGSIRQLYLKWWFTFEWGNYHIETDSDGVVSWETGGLSSSDSVTYLKVELPFLFDEGEIFINGNVETSRFILNEIFKIKLPNFPIQGQEDLKIRMYIPAGQDISNIPGEANEITVEQVVIDKFSCILHFDERRLLNFYKINQTVSDVRERKMEVKVRFGDGPVLNTKNCFKVKDEADFVITNNWYKKGDFPLDEEPASDKLILNPYSKYFSQYRRELTGPLYGEFDFLNTLISRFNKIYIQISTTLNLKKNDFNCALIEVSDFTPSIINTPTSGGLIGTEPSLSAEEGIHDPVERPEITKNERNLTNLNIAEYTSIIIQTNENDFLDFNNYPI